MLCHPSTVRQGVVWERLDEVNGDTIYCDADFNEVRGEEQPRIR